MVFSSLCRCSVLCKALSVDIGQSASSSEYTMRGDVTLAELEVVEALYGRTSPTHDFLSRQFEPDSVPPEYCEVSVNSTTVLSVVYVCTA